MYKSKVHELRVYELREYPLINFKLIHFKLIDSFTPMTIPCQKHLFSLQEDVHYLNCAYMSPLLKSVEQAGVEGMLSKRNPFRVPPSGFFSGAADMKPLFAGLIGATAGRIAIIPSVSYGMGIVARNLKTRPGQQILTVHEDFPSNRYPWVRVCEERQLTLQVVMPPDGNENWGKIWNERILNAINPDTAMVALPHVHWADGTRFDLAQIGQRAKEVGALLVVDGTQSVGALPFNVSAFRVDALICGGYKWLMGPYSLGVAYFGEYFDGGVPLEESWMNRKDSDNFRQLVDYQTEYRPEAARYDVGEHSNFILLPMLTAALRQILAWSPDNIQSYCRQLITPLVAFLRENEFWVEEADWRSAHLMGMRLPAGADMEKFGQMLLERKILVSVRGSSVRISPHLYNHNQDINALLEVLQDFRKAM